nr:MAG TPA: hypothetical protein [Inoviridae sp.]
MISWLRLRLFSLAIREIFSFSSGSMRMLVMGVLLGINYS